MGTTVTHNPFGRFLRGGNTLGALSSAFRLVAGGGGLSGNSLAFDNCAVAPSGPHALGTSYCSPGVVNSSGVGRHLRNGQRRRGGELGEPEGQPLACERVRLLLRFGTPEV